MNAQGSGDPKLSVRGATKIYATGSGDLLAIDRCSLDVAQGEVVSIVGPSGCGKTTLLWAMSGLHALTAGAVLLDGPAVALAEWPRAEVLRVVVEPSAANGTPGRQRVPRSIRHMGRS